ASGRDDEHLPEWMCVPGSASARFERNHRTAEARWRGCLDERINPHVAGEEFRGAFSGRLRSASIDIHDMFLSRSQMEEFAACADWQRPCQFTIQKGDNKMQRKISQAALVSII